jgi:signal transduction histidine kinase/CheY-like chemotaxis protein
MTDGDDMAVRVEAGAAALGEVFEALDQPAILFSAEGRCVLCNARYRRAFFPDDAPPRPGETMLDVKRRMALSGKVKLFSGLSEAEVAEASVQAIRGFVRDMEVPLADGRVLIGSSNPTDSGGYLITFRDAGRDRMGERRALSLLSEAFETAEMGVVLWDASLRVQIANSAWGELFAPVRAGASFRDHVVAVLRASAGRMPDGETVESYVDRTIAAALGQSTQFIMELADGRQAQIANFPTQSGGALTTAIEVTERLRAEQMLTEAIAVMPSGVGLEDSEGRLTHCNAAFGSFYGEAPAKLIGMPFGDRMALIAPRIAAANGRDFTINPAAAMAEMPEMARDAFTPIEASLADGRHYQVFRTELAGGGRVVVMNDISALKSREEETRLARRRLDDAIQSLEEGFALLDDDLRFVAWNQKFSDFALGEAASLAVGMDYTAAARHMASTTLWPPDDWGPASSWSDRLLAQTLAHERNIEFRRRDDRLFRFSAHPTGAGGRLLTVLDITEERRMEAALARQRESAHQTEKLTAMGELLAGVAHELNNPLSVVVGYSMMLRDRMEDPTLARRIAEVSTAAERCARIVKTFLAMARQRPAEIAPVRLDEVIDAATEVAGCGLRAMGAEIAVSLAQDAACVMADADQIVQVFTNLIANAEHALRRRGVDGRLTISTRHDDRSGEIVVSFADNGVGIAAETRSRIFEPFFTTKGADAGTGMGLAFCHRIVTAHGGRITVSSEVGRGARFDVALPACALFDEEADAHAAETPQACGTILVVDDDPAVARLIADMLTDAGYAASVTHDARQAVERCVRKRFVAILCDVRMPGVSGPDFHAHLSRTAPEQAQRLAFMTGDTLSEGVADRLKRAGRPVIEKPVSPAELLAVVARLARGDG